MNLFISAGKDDLYCKFIDEKYIFYLTYVASIFWVSERTMSKILWQCFYLLQWLSSGLENSGNNVYQWVYMFQRRVGMASSSRWNWSGRSSLHISDITCEVITFPLLLWVVFSYSESIRYQVVLNFTASMWIIYLCFIISIDSSTMCHNIITTSEHIPFVKLNHLIGCFIVLSHCWLKLIKLLTS